MNGTDTSNQSTITGHLFSNGSRSIHPIVCSEVKKTRIIHAYLFEYVKVREALSILTCAVNCCNFETSKTIRITYIFTMGVHSRFSVHVADYNCMDVFLTRQQSITSTQDALSSHSFAKLFVVQIIIESIVKLCTPTLESIYECI